MTALAPPKRLLVTSALSLFACGGGDAPGGAPSLARDTSSPDGSPAPERDAGGTVDATPDGSTTDDAAAPKTLRIMTYNIKHGEIGTWTSRPPRARPRRPRSSQSSATRRSRS